jgi:hypothetical protein
MRVRGSVRPTGLALLAVALATSVACSDVTTVQLVLDSKPDDFMKALTGAGVARGDPLVKAVTAGQLECLSGAADSRAAVEQVDVELYTFRLSAPGSAPTIALVKNLSGDNAKSTDALQTALAQAGPLFADAPPLMHDPDLVYLVRVLGYQQAREELIACGISAPLRGDSPPDNDQLPVFALCPPAHPLIDSAANTQFTQYCRSSSSVFRPPFMLAP